MSNFRLSELSLRIITNRPTKHNLYYHTTSSFALEYLHRYYRIESLILHLRVCLVMKKEWKWTLRIKKLLIFPLSIVLVPPSQMSMISHDMRHAPNSIKLCRVTSSYCKSNKLTTKSELTIPNPILCIVYALCM